MAPMCKKRCEKPADKDWNFGLAGQHGTRGIFRLSSLIRGTKQKQAAGAGIGQ
jgi:hypothetical protein